MDSSFSLPQVMLRQTPVDGRLSVKIEPFELALLDHSLNPLPTATKQREIAIPRWYDEPLMMVTEKCPMLHAPRISSERLTEMDEPPFRTKFVPGLNPSFSHLQEYTQHLILL